MIVSALLKQLVLPPGSLISLALAGLSARGRLRVFGTRIALAAALAVFALSTPAVSGLLLRSIQEANATDKSAQAIVILSAGIIANAPEYGGATADALTLERLRFGAQVQRRTKLPILVTGGVLDDRAPPIALVMSRILDSDYGIKAKWIETRSRSTAENASLSAATLRAAGVKRIYLVTHAWHMARARLAFERQGFVVTAAGTGYRTFSPLGPGDFLPSVKALIDSYYALHELIGIAFYSIVL
jgi:uncharacterized SAM-binding protein YcdF (DUF218 family)